MGAKQTSALIPLCHPLPLTSAAVHLALEEASRSVAITARVRTVSATGVEMEALTAVTVAALTVYDMCKARNVDQVADTASSRVAAALVCDTCKAKGTLCAFSYSAKVALTKPCQAQDYPTESLLYNKFWKRPAPVGPSSCVSAVRLQAVSRDITIGEVRLDRKSGGRSGDFQRG